MPAVDDQHGMGIVLHYCQRVERIVYGKARQPLLGCKCLHTGKGGVEDQPG